MIDQNFIRDLEWRELEKLCYAILIAQDQCDVQLNSGSKDNGADLILFDKITKQPCEIVQCKAYSTGSKVTAPMIRDFLGSMKIHNVDYGIFLSTGTFTDDAVQVANKFNITLCTAEDLVESLSKLPLSEQEKIEQEILSRDYKTPTCPSCGIKMVVRKKRGSNKTFWGCFNYPKCKSTLNRASNEIAEFTELPTPREPHREKVRKERRPRRKKKSEPDFIEILLIVFLVGLFLWFNPFK